MPCQSTTEIQARITEIKTVELPNVRERIRALVTGDHSEYWLDTGQSTQRVRRLSLSDLREYEKDLEKELQRLCNSIGSSSVIAVPSNTW
jgi:hypothetical protein